MAFYIMFKDINESKLEMTRSCGIFCWFITPEGKEISSELVMINNHAHFKFDFNNE